MGRGLTILEGELKSDKASGRPTFLNREVEVGPDFIRKL